MVTFVGRLLQNAASSWLILSEPQQLSVPFLSPSVLSPQTLERLVVGFHSNVAIGLEHLLGEVARNVHDRLRGG